MTQYKKMLQDFCTKYDKMEAYEDMLRDVYGDTIMVCGMPMDPVRVLKEMDPIAFRIGFSEYMDCMEEDEENV